MANHYKRGILKTALKIYLTEYPESITKEIMQYFQENDILPKSFRGCVRGEIMGALRTATKDTERLFEKVNKEGNLGVWRIKE